MKKSKTSFILFVFLTVLVWSEVVIGQNYCVPIGSVEDRRNSYDSLVGFVYGGELANYDTSNGVNYTVGLALHIITDDNGNHGVDPQDLQEGLDSLNVAFDQVKIDFAVLFQDTIKNDNFVYTTWNEEEFIVEAYNKSDLVNVYIIPHPSADRATYSPVVMDWYNLWVPACASINHYIILRNASVNDVEFAHEMGHFFDLFHTYESILDSTAYTNPYKTGDLLQDTPPDTNKPRNCDSTDPDEYLLAHNIMAYPSIGSCRSEFTRQQIQKMRYTLETRLDNLIRIDLSLTNKINQQNAGGKLKGIQSGSSQTVNSGENVKLVENKNATVQTLSERFENWAGSGDTYKHHDWNQENSKFKLRKTITVSAGEDQIARFEQLDPVQITNSLISAGGITGGYLHFHDPWYVDANGNQPDDFITISDLPYEPTGAADSTEGGVFLDQGWPNWNPPFYTVRAEQEQTISFHGQDITWYFRGWKGSTVTYEYPNQNQTAVVFQQPDAVAKAIYKGHLASNSDLATAYNNGRRLAVDNGTWHLVYKDGEEIYHTESSNNGSPWIEENRVNLHTGGINSSPSIDIVPVHTPIVTWNRKQSGENFPVLSLAPWTQEIYADADVFCDVNCTPLVTYARFENQYYAYIVARVNNGADKIGLGLLKWTGVTDRDADNLIWIELLPAASETSINPAVTSNPDESMLYYCWEDDGKIHYSYYNVEEESGPSDPPWSSNPLWQGSSDANPSIAYQGNNYVDIVWQHFDGETGCKFRHQRIDNTNPSGEEIVNEVWLWPQSFTRPSVSAVENSQNLFATTLTGGTEFRSLFYDGDEWSLEREFDGTYAGLNEIGEESMVVWTDHTNGLPYLINDHILQTPSGGRSPSTLAESRYREQLIDLSQLPGLQLKGKASLTIGNLQIDGAAGTQDLPFRSLSDSLTYRNFQQSVPVTITPDMTTLRMTYRIKVWDFHPSTSIPEQPLYRINLFNHSSGLPLINLHQLMLNTISGNSLTLTDTLEVNLKPLQGKTVYLQLAGIANQYGGGSIKPVLIHSKEYREYPGEGEILSVAETGVEAIPENWSVYQNYPNPFNPTTTITYDIPEQSRVNLAIYDVTGRLIRNLVDRIKPAGQHRAIWDGTDNSGRQVASGLYVYRLTSSPLQKGGRGDVKSRKMLLMK